MSERSLSSEQRLVNSARDQLYAYLSDGGNVAPAAADRRAERIILGHQSDQAYAVREALVGNETPLLGRIELLDGRTFLIGRRFGFIDGDPGIVNSLAQKGVAFYQASPESPMGLAAVIKYEFKQPWILSRVRRVDFLIQGQQNQSDPFDVDDYIKDEREWLRAALTDVRRTREFRDSIRTLQANQHRISQTRLDAPLVVQGGPGTGKTMVGIERAAYANHTQANADLRVLFVGPTQAFRDYVEPTLRSAGIGLVELKLLSEISLVREPSPESAVAAHAKGTDVMVQILEQSVFDLIEPRALEIRVRSRGADRELMVNFSEEEIGGDVARSRVDPTVAYASARGQFVDRLTNRVYERVGEFQRRNPGWEPAGLDAAINSSAEKIWPTIDAKRDLRWIYRNSARFEREIRSAGISGMGGGALDEIRQQTEWTLADAPLLDELRRIGGERTFEQYGHVVVDEAQNLSPMAVRMLMRLSRRQSITFLGDLAQSVGPFKYQSWAEMFAGIPVRYRDNIKIENLETGYRIPRPIMAVATAFLETIDPHGTIQRVEPVVDEGRNPKLDVSGPGDFASHVSHIVKVMQAEDDVEEVLVIVACRAARDEIVDELGRSNSVNELGIRVLLATDVTGLEVDGAIVVDPGAIAELIPDRPELLYVALTRAARYLAIVASERPLWLGEGLVDAA